MKSDFFQGERLFKNKTDVKFFIQNSKQPGKKMRTHVLGLNLLKLAGCP